MANNANGKRRTTGPAPIRATRQRTAEARAASESPHSAISNTLSLDSSTAGPSNPPPSPQPAAASSTRPTFGTHPNPPSPAIPNPNSNFTHTPGAAPSAPRATTAAARTSANTAENIRLQIELAKARTEEFRAHSEMLQRLAATPASASAALPAISPARNTSSIPSAGPIPEGRDFGSTAKCHHSTWSSTLQCHSLLLLHHSDRQRGHHSFATTRVPSLPSSIESSSTVLRLDTKVLRG